MTEATAEPGAERTTYWDEAHPGFGLMVTRNGHRSYVVQYRTGRRSRRMHLKNGLTLTAARREAKAILGDVARNRDPLGERRKAERAESDTLKAIVEEYLTREGKRLRSINERRATLQRHVLPRLGTRQIGDITRTDIVRLLDRIADKTGAPMSVAARLTLSPAAGSKQSRTATASLANGVTKPPHLVGRRRICSVCTPSQRSRTRPING